MKKIVFISNNTLGSGLSGGERIFIELMKGWKKYADITFIGSEEAQDMCLQRGTGDIAIIVSAKRNPSPYRETIPGLFWHYVKRLVCGLRALRQNRALLDSADVVYSASDAFPDFFPVLILKLRRRDIFWIAGYYLFVPKPFAKDSPYKGRHRIRGLLYWLMQIPSHFLVNRYADCVFVTSEPDVEKFVTKFRSRDRVIVIRGGVDTTESEKYLSSDAVVPPSARKYDVCFVGRLHYQKGALELVDIWRHVIAAKPDAKLVMIGNGPLDAEIKARIKAAELDASIEMVGFKDGEDKFKIFRNSKLIVHPAIYDSGGMAAAEGMAWKLPGVSFDLEALKTYYPKGMLKTEKGNFRQFADNILKLLDNDALYEKMSDDAHKLIVEDWDWSRRSDKMYKVIFG